MSDKELIFAATAAVTAVVLIGIFTLRKWRTAHVRNMLREVALGFGWSDVRDLHMRDGVTGVWHSSAVRFEYIADSERTPAYLKARIDAQAGARLTIKRRRSGFFPNRPLALWGLPLVEVHAPAAAKFWVRTNEPNLAERVFADSGLAEMVEHAVLGRNDELSVDRRGVRVVRSFTDPATRSRSTVRSRSFTRVDAAALEPVARREWEAVQAFATKLALI